MSTKRLLGEIYSLQLTGRATSRELATRLPDVEGSLRRGLRSLKKAGLVEGSATRPRLTARGRKKIKVVFIGGGFEIIHPGHLYSIEQAKRLGDVLVVVLARDSTIRRRKGRDPITPEQERLTLLASLRPVDAAILGVEGNIYESLEKVKPDIVALGYDQQHAEEEIEREASERGIRLKVVRLKALTPDMKTSRILAEFA